MLRAAALVAAVAVLGGCNGCQKTAANDAGTVALADAGVRAPDRDEWWVSLPDLPEGALDVGISTLLIDGPPERQWAWEMGPFCDGFDPFLGVTPGEEEERQKVAGLRCGQALYEHLPKGKRRYALQLNRSGHQMMPMVFALPSTYQRLDELEPLLSGFHHEKLGAFDGLCRAYEPGVTTCKGADNSGKAIALSDGHLLGGQFDELEELLQSPQRYWLLTELDEITAHFSALDPSLQVELDLIPKGSKWVIGPRRWLPYTRDEFRPLSEAVRHHARAVGWESAWDQGRGAIILVPRCSTTACPERDLLAAALRTYHSAWAPEAPKRMDALGEELGDEARGCGVHERAILDAAAKAQVTLTAHGTVELRYATDGGVPDPERCAAKDRERNERALAEVRAALK